MTVPPSLETRLEGLAVVINAEHDEFRRVGRVALEHAVKCGQALLEAQSCVPHGQWLAWMRANVRVHPSTVYKYMRLARYPKRVLASDATGVEDALRLIADAPWHNRTLLSDDEKALMASLVKAEGPKAVADAFGVATSTVWRWTSETGAAAARADGLSKRGRAPTHALIEITDEMIEAAAVWLVERFGDANYATTVNDRVRDDALELLGRVLKASEPAPKALAA